MDVSRTFSLRLEKELFYLLLGFNDDNYINNSNIKN